MHASIYLWRGDVLGFALLHDTCAYYCASIGNIRMLNTSRVRPMHESVVLLVLRFASHQSFRKCLCFRRDWYECLKVIWWSVNPETLGGWSNRSTKTRCRAGLWQLLRVSVVVRLSLTCRVAWVLLIRSPQKTRREDSDHLVFLLSRSCGVYMVTCVFASFSYYYNGRALHSMRWIGRGNNAGRPTNVVCLLIGGMSARVSMVRFSLLFNVICMSIHVHVWMMQGKA